MSHPVAEELHRLLEVASVPLEIARPHLKMAVGEHPWTASSLASALMELVIAFIFLAGASISYFTSKFVRVFGLHPPCFDRDRTSFGRRSGLQSGCPHCDRRSKELYVWRHCVFHRNYIQSNDFSEHCSPSTSCSECDTLSSLEPNQLYFTCRRHRPLMADQGVHRTCSHHTYPHATRAAARDFGKSAALKSLIWCENDAHPANGDNFICRSSIVRKRKYHRFGKRKLNNSLFFEGPPDSCGISDEDGIADGEMGSSHPLEREHSLKVFPEEFIDCHALSQEREQKRVPESSQDLGNFDTAHHSTFETQAAEYTLQQSLDDLHKSSCESENSYDTGAQISGHITDFLTESLLDKVIDVSELHAVDEQSEPAAEDPKRNIETCIPICPQHTTLIETSIIADDEEPEDPGNEDSIKLKERIAAERAVLNRTYAELEKERIASIAATHEAMATITRLQKDKADLQMEGLQYQRIAEEKAMFDEEAILVLQDSLLKREAEKLVLEKEIEVYKLKLLRAATKQELSDLEESKVTGDPCVAYLTIENRAELQNLQASRHGKSSGPMVALKSDEREHEKRKAEKPTDSADKQRQHVLERMCNLEEQVIRLQAKHEEASIATVSGQVNTSDRTAERGEISEYEIYQYNASSAKESVPQRNLEDAQYSKRFLAAESVNGHVLSIPGGTRTDDRSNVIGSLGCKMDSCNNILVTDDDNVRGDTEASTDTMDWVAMPNPYFSDEVLLNKAELPAEKELSTSSTSSSLSFRLGLETSVPDEERGEADDDVNEGSRHTSPGVSYSDFWPRTSNTRETSKGILKDMQKLRCRLQVLEADTQLISETIESMRQGTEELERLQEVGQQLKLLRLADVAKMRGQEICHYVLHDSAIEAVKSPAHKRQCKGET